MPVVNDSAIVIRTWDYSETSQTVSLFTRTHGILRGLAKGARREKGAFSGGFEVLTRGDFVAYLKSGRDLANLASWDLTFVCRSLRRDLHAFRIGMYLADLVHHMITDHDPHERLFDAMSTALYELDRRQQHDLTLLRFQWALLRETGYQPELHRDAATGRSLPSEADVFIFNSQSGGLVPDDGEGGRSRWRVRRETVDLLRRVASIKPDRECITSDNGAVDRANRLLACYVREILGNELPTMPVMFPGLG